jgi:hypothetical protein
MANGSERRTTTTMNSGDGECQGMTNSGYNKDEVGLTNSRNGGTNGGTPHPRFKRETVGHFFCYLFLLFSLSSPIYAAASTCSQGINALILFNILN